MQYTAYERAIQLLRDYAKFKGHYSGRSKRKKRGHHAGWERVTPLFSQNAVAEADNWLRMMNARWNREGRINSCGYLRVRPFKRLDLFDVKMCFPHLTYKELVEIYPCIQN